MRYREIRDPLDDIIGKFLSREENRPNEDDIIDAIDRKYQTIHLDILYLNRQGASPKQICKILQIGEMSYLRALKKLKEHGVWKSYEKRK